MINFAFAFTASNINIRSIPIGGVLAGNADTGRLPLCFGRLTTIWDASHKDTEIRRILVTLLFISIPAIFQDAIGCPLVTTLVRRFLYSSI